MPSSIALEVVFGEVLAPQERQEVGALADHLPREHERGPGDGLLDGDELPGQEPDVRPFRDLAIADAGVPHGDG